MTLICVKFVHSYCPHCGEIAPQKVVREVGRSPLLWCEVCRRVTVSENLSVAIDPLVFGGGLSVRAGELDDDHERLVDILNDLHEAARAPDWPRVAALFAALMRDLHEHFGREEALLAEWRYPELESHRAVHQALAAEVEGFLEKLSTSVPADVPDIVLAVKLCLVEHLAEDGRYKDHLAAAMAGSREAATQQT